MCNIQDTSTQSCWHVYHIKIVTTRYAQVWGNSSQMGKWNIFNILIATRSSRKNGPCPALTIPHTVSHLKTGDCHYTCLIKPIITHPVFINRYRFYTYRILHKI
jgi:hypothetical protein